MRWWSALIGLMLMVRAAGAAPINWSGPALPPPVHWLSSWDAGWRVSRLTKRPILLMFATSWSPWCKSMDDQVWTLPHLRLLASRYVMVRVDAEKEVLMANRFKVLGYPTILLSWEGNPLGRDVGPIPAPELVKLMQKGLQRQAQLKTKLR